MYILSFDVTSNNISICISNGDIILSQIDQKNNSNQSEFLTILLQESLQNANLDYKDLDLVAFTNGPASFTSVRIGYIAAKMINLCHQTPLLDISSNLAIASDYIDTSYLKIVTALDARLGDVFFQIFDLKNGKLTENSDIIIVKIEEIEQYLPKEEFLLVGSGKKLISDFLKDKNFNLGTKEDIIKSSNINKIAFKYYKNEGKIPDEPIYIRQPRIG
ncbi:tRNA (adenosine(37)-N6)-threonylcarbamoyltransferase complex dimerization subunit type 1 TsaB [Rickettsiales bacterium]|nr:tRNA (adenosine(37)-N6)-threonylcarbamoyltransferase complex dimerization subunit type 1 TsaB [Rickettsiales bacterium]